MKEALKFIVYKLNISRKKIFMLLGTVKLSPKAAVRLEGDKNPL